MKHVEFTNCPPAFEVAKADGQVAIRFYDNVQTVTRQDQDGTTTGYVADCYELITNVSANLATRINNNYQVWLNKAKEADNSLAELKEERIKQSKAMLADYIAAHPLTSTAHGGVAGVYSVTEEKQAQMTSQYISYQAEKAINPNAVLTWNETGKSCETWTEAEFLQLVIEIKQYVYPLVSHQQAIEERINAASSIDEIESIIIDYDEA